MFIYEDRSLVLTYNARWGWIPRRPHSCATWIHDDPSPRSRERCHTCAWLPQPPPALWASRCLYGECGACVCGGTGGWLRLWNRAWRDVYPDLTAQRVPSLCHQGHRLVSEPWENGGLSPATGSQESSSPAGHGRPGCSRGSPRERLSEMDCR